MLESELGTLVHHYYKYGRWNYSTAFALRFSIVISSIIAGVGGLASALPHQVFAFIAFLPAALSVFATNLKYQDRANWHYRGKDALNRLLNRLRFELPDPPTPEAVAAISQEMSELNVAMSAEWEALFGLDTQLILRSETAKPPP
jgi:hypothetical protein